MTLSPSVDNNNKISQILAVTIIFIIVCMILIHSIYMLFFFAKKSQFKKTLVLFSYDYYDEKDLKRENDQMISIYII